jgi:hypothetical protein
VGRRGWFYRVIPSNIEVVVGTMDVLDLTIRCQA